MKGGGGFYIRGRGLIPQKSYHAATVPNKQPQQMLFLDNSDTIIFNSVI